MRHRIANLFYAIGGAIDAPAVTCEGGKTSVGDGPKYEPARDDYTSANTGIHLRDSTPIWADFHPPEHGYSYAALHVGRGMVTTIFLTRLTTLRLLSALQHVERQFTKYGEGNAR